MNLSNLKHFFLKSFCLSMVSCTQHTDQIKNESEVDSNDYSINQTLYEPTISVDSLISIHQDSLIFMNFWSGMTYLEYEQVLDYEIKRRNIFSIGAPGERKNFVPLYFDDIEYLFQIEYKNPNYSETNFPLHYHDLPPNGLILLTAYEGVRQGSQSSTGQIIDGDTLWTDHIDRYRITSNGKLSYKEYNSLDKTYNSKYSSNKKVKLVNQDDMNFEKESHIEYRIDGVRCISFRRLPFPDPNFNVVFRTGKKPVVKSESNKNKSLSDIPISTNKPEYEEQVSFDKNGKVIKPAKAFKVIYMSKSSLEYLINLEKSDAYKNRLIDHEELEEKANQKKSTLETI